MKTIKRMYVDARDGIVPAQMAIAFLLGTSALTGYGIWNY